MHSKVISQLKNMFSLVPHNNFHSPEHKIKKNKSTNIQSTYASIKTRLKEVKMQINKKVKFVLAIIDWWGNSPQPDDTKNHQNGCNKYINLFIKNRMDHSIASFEARCRLEKETRWQIFYKNLLLFKAFFGIAYVFVCGFSARSIWLNYWSCP